MYTSVVFPTTAGTQGIYKSTNGGANWTRVSTTAMNNLIVANTSNIEITVGRQNNIFVGIVNRGAVLQDSSDLVTEATPGPPWTFPRPMKMEST